MKNKISFRKNNLVDYNGSITRLSPEDVRLLKSDVLEKFKPILLTDGILGYFGFKYEKNISTKEFYRTYPGIYYKLGYDISDKIYFYYYDYKLLKFKYLHELQNCPVFKNCFEIDHNKLKEINYFYLQKDVL